MAATVKKSWHIKRYARGGPGKWKYYDNENQDMIFSYLEAEHFLLTKKDVILESFSLINSKTHLRGNAKGDSMMIIHNVREGNCRSFRLQFSEDDGASGILNCENCVKMLRAHFPIKYHSGGTQKNPETSTSEVSEIDKELLSQMMIRRAYHMDTPLDYIKETVHLCLTDSSFPAYVEAVEQELKNIK